MNKLDLWLRGFSLTARYEGEGDMKEEQLRAVYAALTDDVKWDAAAAIVQRELAEMRKTITPEALDEALWPKGSDGAWYYPIDFANGQFVEVSFRDAMPEVSVVFHDSSIRAKGVKTMRDLFVLYAALRGDE